MDVVIHLFLGAAVDPPPLDLLKKLSKYGLNHPLLTSYLARKELNFWKISVAVIVGVQNASIT